MQPAASKADGASGVLLMKGEAVDSTGPVNNEKLGKGELKMSQLTRFVIFLFYGSDICLSRRCRFSSTTFSRVRTKRQMTRQPGRETQRRR